MKASSLNLGKEVAGRILLTQLSIALTGSLLASVLSFEAGYSALLGGLIATAANAYFAIKAFTYSGASQARRMMTSVYQGEAGKFVITVTLLLLVFKFVPNVHPMALILTYSATVLGHVLAPILFRSKPKGAA